MIQYWIYSRQVGACSWDLVVFSCIWFEEMPHWFKIERVNAMCHCHWIFTCFHSCIIDDGFALICIKGSTITIYYSLVVSKQWQREKKFRWILLLMARLHFDPPASESIGEVANFIKRKTHNHLYTVLKMCNCLSVRHFGTHYLMTG